MTGPKFFPEVQPNNEPLETARPAQPHGAPVASAMASAVKFIQEEMWIREWENKNASGLDERSDGEFAPTVR